jgi:hypothetical protein
VIIAYVNAPLVPLQIATAKQDGTPHVMVSGTVRVYSISALGAEVVALAPTALVGTAAPLWRYAWAPATLAEGQYIVEYTMTDASQTYAPVTEDLTVRAATDLSGVEAAGAAAAAVVGLAATGEAAAAVVGLATATDVTTATSGLAVAGEAAAALTSYGPTVPGDLSGLALTGESAAAGTQLRADIITDHGAGAYNGVATGQAVRDSLALALTPGTVVAAGSVDRHLDNIEQRADAGAVFGSAFQYSEARYYQNDVGIDFFFDYRFDVSAATLLEVHIKKPSGATQTWTGTLFAEQQIHCVTAAGWMNETGLYRAQAYYEMAGGIKGHVPTYEFRVYPEFG